MYVHICMRMTNSMYIKMLTLSVGIFTGFHSPLFFTFVSFPKFIFLFFSILPLGNVM